MHKGIPSKSNLFIEIQYPLEASHFTIGHFFHGRPCISQTQSLRLHHTHTHFHTCFVFVFLSAHLSSSFHRCIVSYQALL